MDFANFGAVCADLISGINTPRLPHVLADFLSSQIDFDRYFAMILTRQNCPTILHHTVSSDQREILVDRYAGGAYTLDPFYIAALKRRVRGVRSIRELGFVDSDRSEYSRSYYGLIPTLDEIGFIVELDCDTVFHISIDRRSSERFSATDVERARTLYPVIAQAIRKHSAFSRDASEVKVARTSGIRDKLRSFGSSVLTKRESEIAFLLMQGLSAKASGLKLGIAPGTVVNHRRNIYAKLGITSQAELFRLILESLEA